MGFQCLNYFLDIYCVSYYSYFGFCHYKPSKFPNKLYLLACSSKITIHQVKQYNAYIPHQSTFFGCTNGVTKIINLDDVTKGHTRISKEIYCWVRFLLIGGYALLHVSSHTYWDSTRRPQNIWIIYHMNKYISWLGDIAYKLCYKCYRINISGYNFPKTFLYLSKLY